VDYSRDPVGIKELIEGLDIHTANQNAFELPSRLIAKIFLFRTIYRGSGWSFAHDPSFSHVSTSADFWDDMNAKFYKKYAGLDKQHSVWGQQVLQHGFIDGFTGRRWKFDLKEKKDWKTGKIEKVLPWTDLTNYPIQGTGNDLMAIARNSLFNRLTKFNIPAILVSTVHDSVVCDTPAPLEVAQLMYEVFDDIPLNIKKLFGYETAVPYPCEAKMGLNLKDMEPVPRKK
jgi:DNA polymerase I-like protein with 3'-5' exonuclease and polymerase domains